MQAKGFNLILSFVFLASLIRVNSAAAAASSITYLFNTGLDVNGQLLPDGSVDPHYTIVANSVDGSSASTAVTQTTGYPIQGAYVAPASGSEWIEPSAYFPGQNAPPGIFDYQTNFTLPAGAVSVSIAAQFAADDEMSLFLNGIEVVPHIGGSGQGDFFSLIPIQFASQDVVAGTNTLTFSVMNDPPNGPQNPTALTVDFVSATYELAQPVPEINSAAIVSLALVAFGTKRNRRRGFQF